MAEERAHRPAREAGHAASGRTRVWNLLGLGRDPALPRPRTPHLEALRRPWIAAFWQARVAVRAGVPLDDFLRSRLARYLAALSAPRSRLPLAVDVEDGQIRVRAAGDPAPPGPSGPEAEAWLEPLVRAEGPAVRQEVTEIEVRLALLDGEIDAAARRASELSRRLAADVSSGLVAAPASIEATAEQMGRPPVRSGAPHAAALTVTACAVLAEGWQIALPLFRTAGLSAEDLGADAARRPAEVLFVSVFALGVALGLFALAHAGLQALAGAFEVEPDARRRRWLAVGAAGAGALASLVAAALAALPPGAAPGAPPASFALLLVAVPVATALLLRWSRLREAQRSLETAAALAWDRERARALSDRARRLEEVAWAEEEARALERQREAARRRLRELNARAVEASRIAEEAEHRERAALSRAARSLVAALELDRWEFVRQASARGALDLLSPRRRKAPDPHPPAFDPDSTTQVEVETGRLAS